MKEIQLTETIERLPKGSKELKCNLILTHQCNLNCCYCYERHKGHGSMTFEIAINSINEQIDCILHNNKYQWLMIELFGGEPLLQFPLIKQIVAWVRENNRGCPIMFMMTTNGTLFTEEKKKWFRENRDMVVFCVSYDGSEEAQRQNRRATIDDALAFCHEVCPNMSFRMTISPDTVGHFAKDIMNAYRRGYQMRAVLANDVEWNETHRELFEKQLRKWKAICLEYDNIIPSLLTPPFHGGEDSDEPCTRRCDAGIKTPSYDIDGKKYTCYLFTPVIAGERVMPWGQYNPDDPSNHNDEECEHCPIKHRCPTCPASNYIYRGSFAKRNHSVCRMNLTQAMVTLEYQMEIMTRKALTKEDVALMKGLIRIYDKVKTKINMPK